MERRESVHRRRTLYLVRHGEALHNVKEAEAQAKARLLAQEEGLSEEETLQKMEAARKEVLKDQSFFDAPLTDKGRLQARRTGELLARLVGAEWEDDEDDSSNYESDEDEDDDNNACPAVTAEKRVRRIVQSNEIRLHPPTEAMVSPLSRCLETAEIMLHQHFDSRNTIKCNNPNSKTKNGNNDNKNGNTNSHNTCILDPELKVHIRPEIRERQTQFPADTPKEMGHLLNWTQQKYMSNTKGPFKFHVKEQALKGNYDLSVEESKTMLRERASKLFHVLMEMHHTHIFICSHKGYLREMERGLLGLSEEDSPLFANGELRVYRVVFTRGERALKSVERLV